MEKKNIFINNKTKIILKLLIIVCLLIISIIEPNKLLGYYLSYPLKFFFGEIYVFFSLYLIGLIFINIFKKEESKTRKYILVGIFVIYVGICSIISVKNLNMNYSFKDAINLFFNSFKDSTRLDLYNLFINSKLDGGFIGKVSSRIFYILGGKVISYIISSIVIFIGLSIICFYLYQNIKSKEELKENIDSNKDKVYYQKPTVNNKFTFEYEDSSKLDGYDDSSVDMSIDEVVIEPLQKVKIEDLESKQTNEEKPKSKYFNIFTDLVIDEEELLRKKAVEKVQMGEKFSIFKETFTTENDNKEELPIVEEKSIDDSSFIVPIDKKEESKQEETFTDPSFDNIEENPNNIDSYQDEFYGEEDEDFDSHIFDDEYTTNIDNPTSNENLNDRVLDADNDDFFIINCEHYRLPDVSLLNDSKKEDHSLNEQEARMNAFKIEEKLNKLNIIAKVEKITVAPSFTRFYIKTPEEVKIGAIPNVSKDLMMALSAKTINVQAPLPGTNYVGVDIPNKYRTTVSFKECLTSIPFDKQDSKLLLVLGKDINEETVCLTLNDMQHVLIAGTTGSGKSVCLNSIIMSLIMRYSPQEVELMLVDKKKVEFLSYAFIPHLICPIISDVKKAIVALDKVCEEMDKRYDIFTKYNKKNIGSYNRYMDETGGKRMPYFVVVIDELGDLILESKGEVEESIIRLATIARACGIYLVLATQRPTVDVVTGIIKSNIPSRIAFHVVDNGNSRVILDESGAEDLLGKGDMLIKTPDMLNYLRAQGCYLDENEIERVTKYLSNVSTQHFNPEFLDLEPKEDDIDYDYLTGENDDKENYLFSKALEYISINKEISNTSLRKRFRWAYSTAARILDKLEEEGLIGPVYGNKPREVYTLKVKEYVENRNNK